MHPAGQGVAWRAARGTVASRDTWRKLNFIGQVAPQEAAEVRARITPDKRVKHFSAARQEPRGINAATSGNEMENRGREKI